MFDPPTGFAAPTTSQSSDGPLGPPSGRPYGRGKPKSPDQLKVVRQNEFGGQGKQSVKDAKRYGTFNPYSDVGDRYDDGDHGNAGNLLPRTPKNPKGSPSIKKALLDPDGHPFMVRAGL